MANTLQIKRGTKINLPTLSAGEFGLTTDTDELYIGNGASNIELVTEDWVTTSVGDPGSDTSIPSEQAVREALGSYILESTFTQDSGILVGTGAGTFQEETGATARSSLGLAIGTNVQAYDADLDGLAELSETGMLTRTAGQTYTERTIIGTANEITVINGDGVSGNPTLSLPSAVNLGDASSLATDEIKAYDGAGLKLYDDGGNGIFVEDGGKVGIGTNSPSKLLTIQAASGSNADIRLIADAGEDSQDDWRITADGAGLKFQDVYGRYPLFIGYNAGVEVRIGTGAGYDFQVDNTDGDRLFTVQGETGNTKIPKDDAKLYFGADDNGSIYYDGSDMVLDSQETGTGDFHFKNGKVGIGTDNPSYSLDTTGDINIASEKVYRINGSQISTSDLSNGTGISDNNILLVDDADAADDDYAKFTANGLQGRSYSEVKTDLSLNNVPNEDATDPANWDPANTDGNFLVGNGSTFVAESGSTARTSMGAAESGGAEHDGFSDFVANEHINHTSVTLTAGDGLSGGGDISSNRTFDVNINGAADLAAPAIADELLISDNSDSNNIKKADLASIVDARLSGGTGIDYTTGTIAIDATVIQTTDTDVSGTSWVLDQDDMSSDDATKVPTQQSVKAYVDNNAGGGGASQLSDLSDVNTSTTTNRNVLVADGVDWESRALVEDDISDLGSYAVSGGAEHDGFSDFVANEHIDHSTVSITAGTGLTGGGTIASTRTINVDINGAADLAAPAIADELLISDIDDSNNVKKADLASIVDARLSGGIGITYSSGTISIFPNLVKYELKASEDITIPDKYQYIVHEYFDVGDNDITIQSGGELVIL